MEQRLDRLSEILSSAGKVAIAKETVASLPPLQPASQSRIEASPPVDFKNVLTDFAPPDVAPQMPQTFFQQRSIPESVFDDIDDVISKGLVGFQEAEESLCVFRTKALDFPFVVLSPHTSLDTMRREKPFLLLTILAWDSQESFRLQKTLELEIREQLSRKAVFNGERSLDLLQGIMIYLCWYQLYFNAERQQIYQLSQMVASMAVDLGINQPTQNLLRQNYFTIHDANLHIPTSDKMPEGEFRQLANFSVSPRTQSPLQNSSFTGNTPSQNINSRNPCEEIEARRTFLGCYWLSSSLALSLRKPTSLKYSDYVGDCAQILGQLAEAETDYLLPHFVALQRFAEDVNQAFDYDSGRRPQQLDTTRVEIISRSFVLQLDQIQSSFPPAVWNNIGISMSFHFLCIYINEVGFHASAPSPYDLMSGQSSPKAYYFSAARNESLIACLQACKNYLDRFIELTPRQTIDFILPNYLRLVYAVLILGRFATGCDCPILDASDIRQSTNMGYYLDKLISKVDESMMLLPATDANDWMRHVRKMWQQSKWWYEAIVRDPAAAMDCAIGQPELNFMDILPSAISSCVDFSVTPQSCDERWADMLDWGSNVSVSDSLNPFAGCTGVGM
ncbi:Transcription factor himD [Hyphodiscus hymeniophilus]|uniref:Transcription factor himD n=1 Tax=Hyphodiscus hymeniophilus TaxID=353542 RepID=A0A9P6VHZ4_9HELO|nr:Transcription factor himD [Hyphodiscus hymeniophilus]